LAVAASSSLMNPLGHVVEDVIAAIQRPARVLERVVERGRLGDAGEQGGLREIQLARRLREVDPRRGLTPTAVRPFTVP
jgi:hypothetical protein